MLADLATLRRALHTLTDAPWRTRFAPAPTGALHIGHVVNAIYVWSIARAFGGEVVLRIEDHDRGRARPEYERGILDDLAWLGLRADHGHAPDGIALDPHARQSARTARYSEWLSALAHTEEVYACQCSRADIQRAIGATLPGEELRYPGTCRAAPIPEASTHARRVRLPSAAVTFDDMRHGTLTQVPADQCGDLLLRDRDGSWTYQFAVVVDDMDDDVSVIVRGDDLLGSTGRQWLLAEMLGRATPPRVLHHPLVLHADGQKLSKSRGDTGIAELRANGLTPDAVLGRAAFLGGLAPTEAPITAIDLASLWRV
jgi:glutamyl-Q tRNA(Asp) synthetase